VLGDDRSQKTALLGSGGSVLHSTCLFHGHGNGSKHAGADRWHVWKMQLADHHVVSQPTFNPTHATAPLHHDVVLLDRWSVALNIYKRGDVVTLW
jgi:hypothetical protein